MDALIDKRKGNNLSSWYLFSEFSVSAYNPNPIIQIFVTHDAVHRFHLFIFPRRCNIKGQCVAIQGDRVSISPHMSPCSKKVAPHGRKSLMYVSYWRPLIKYLLGFNYAMLMIILSTLVFFLHVDATV